MFLRGGRKGVSSKMIIQVSAISPSRMSTMFARNYPQNVWWEEQVSPTYVIRNEYYLCYYGDYEKEHGYLPKRFVCLGSREFKR